MPKAAKKNSTPRRTASSRKAAQRPERGLSAAPKRQQREIAALDFKPVFKPRAGFLRLYGDDTFRELGATTRTAILLLSASKLKMIKAAEEYGGDEWFRMLDDLHGASEILAAASVGTFKWLTLEEWSQRECWRPKSISVPLISLD
jgi:hypothetical protein